MAMKTCSDAEEEVLEEKKHKNAYKHKALGNFHTFYLSGEIGESSEYIDWFDVIRNSSETDVIRFHINSYGGDLFTAIQFMRCMAECKSKIIASVEGVCMSAATIIFLSADIFEISEHSMFMFHNYSGMILGKGGEMYDNILHERKWSEKLFTSIYKDFLTKAEVESILENKDIWMDSSEVLKRLNKKGKIDNASKTTKK